MSEPLLQILIPVLVAGIAAIAPTMAARSQKRTADGQQTLDLVSRWQEWAHEMRAAADAHEKQASELRTELAALSARVTVLESRENAWRSYVAMLRGHIDQELPPPPPPFPSTLTP